MKTATNYDLEINGQYFFAEAMGNNDFLLRNALTGVKIIRKNDSALSDALKSLGIYRRLQAERMQGKPKETKPSFFLAVCRAMGIRV